MVGLTRDKLITSASTESGKNKTIVEVGTVVVLWNFALQCELRFACVNLVSKLGYERS